MPTSRTFDDLILALAREAFQGDFPVDTATVVLMNPPFPHKKTDAQPERFVERALEGLKHGGRLAVIVPLSLLVKRDKSVWRRKLLAKNTLNAAIKLPDELFQPYAQPYTVILYMTKGIPHPSQRPVFFARVENDGHRLKKGARIHCDGDEFPRVLEAYQASQTIGGFCGWSGLDADWSFAPGAYIPARPLTEEEVDAGVLALVRSRSAFIVYHAPEIVRLETSGRPYREVKKAPTPTPPIRPTIGGHFDIFYGQKALHNKEALAPGTTLVISSSGMDNGCYGFFDFDERIASPFVTVPSTGSIGIAHVQERACGVTDDCLVLLLKKGVPHELLYVAAAVIRHEAWRFSYGRKATPDRIAGFPLPTGSGLIDRVREYLRLAERVERLALRHAEDALDAQTARARLTEIEVDPGKSIRGEDLECRLAGLDK